MEVVLAVAARNATEDSDRALSIHGIHDGMVATSVPCLAMQIVLVIRIIAKAEDQGRAHNLRWILVDEEGNLVVLANDTRIDVPIEVDASRHPINVTKHLRQVPFLDYGEYSFDISIDGDHMMSVPYNIFRP